MLRSRCILWLLMNVCTQDLLLVRCEHEKIWLVEKLIIMIIMIINIAHCRNKYRISSHNKNYKMYYKNSNHCKKTWENGFVEWLDMSNGQKSFVDIGQLYNVEVVVAVAELLNMHVYKEFKMTWLLSAKYDYGNCNECVVLSVLPFLGHT